MKAFPRRELAGVELLAAAPAAHQSAVLGLRFRGLRRTAGPAGSFGRGGRGGGRGAPGAFGTVGWRCGGIGHGRSQGESNRERAISFTGRLEVRRFGKGAHFMQDSFGSHGTLAVGGESLKIARLAALEKRGYDLSRLPYSLKILLENLLRREDGSVVSADDIEPSRAGTGGRAAHEIAFTPGARPAAGLHRRAGGRRPGRDARRDGGDGRRSRPRSTRCSRSSWSSTTRCRSTSSARRGAAQPTPSWSSSATASATLFLRWGQKAFRNFRVVPPDTGIVHQVNLEYLARSSSCGERTADVAPTPTRWSAPTRTRR